MSLPENEDELESIGSTKTKIKKDASTFLRATEIDIIDQVLLSVSHEGYKFVKVKVRTVKTPQIGDKVSS